MLSDADVIGSAERLPPNVTRQPQKGRAETWSEGTNSTTLNDYKEDRRARTRP